MRMIYVYHSSFLPPRYKKRTPGYHLRSSFLFAGLLTEAGLVGDRSHILQLLLIGSCDDGVSASLQCHISGDTGSDTKLLILGIAGSYDTGRDADTNITNIRNQRPGANL